MLRHLLMTEAEILADLSEDIDSQVREREDARRMKSELWQQERIKAKVQLRVRERYLLNKAETAQTLGLKDVRAELGSYYNSTIGSEYVHTVLKLSEMCDIRAEDAPEPDCPAMVRELFPKAGDSTVGVYTHVLKTFINSPHFERVVESGWVTIPETTKEEAK